MSQKGKRVFKGPMTKQMVQSLRFFRKDDARRGRAQSVTQVVRGVMKNVRKAPNQANYLARIILTLTTSGASLFRTVSQYFVWVGGIITNLTRYHKSRANGFRKTNGIMALLMAIFCYGMVHAHVHYNVPNHGPVKHTVICPFPLNDAAPDSSLVCWEDKKTKTVVMNTTPVEGPKQEHYILGRTGRSLLKEAPTTGLLGITTGFRTTSEEWMKKFEKFIMKNMWTSFLIIFVVYSITGGKLITTVIGVVVVITLYSNTAGAVGPADGFAMGFGDDGYFYLRTKLTKLEHDCRLTKPVFDGTMPIEACLKIRSDAISIVVGTRHNTGVAPRSLEWALQKAPMAEGFYNITDIEAIQAFTNDLYITHPKGNCNGQAEPSVLCEYGKVQNYTAGCSIEYGVGNEKRFVVRGRGYYKSYKWAGQVPVRVYSHNKLMACRILSPHWCKDYETRMGPRDEYFYFLGFQRGAEASTPSRLIGGFMIYLARLVYGCIHMEQHDILATTSSAWADMTLSKTACVSITSHNGPMLSFQLEDTNYKEAVTGTQSYCTKMKAKTSESNAACPQTGGTKCATMGTTNTVCTLGYPDRGWGNGCFVFAKGEVCTCVTLECTENEVNTIRVDPGKIEAKVSVTVQDGKGTKVSVTMPSTSISDTEVDLNKTGRIYLRCNVQTTHDWGSIRLICFPTRCYLTDVASLNSLNLPYASVGAALTGGWMKPESMIRWSFVRPTSIDYELYGSQVGHLEAVLKNHESYKSEKTKGSINYPQGVDDTIQCRLKTANLKWDGIELPPCVDITLALKGEKAPVPTKAGIITVGVAVGTAPTVPCRLTSVVTKTYEDATIISGTRLGSDPVINMVGDYVITHHANPGEHYMIIGQGTTRLRFRFEVEGTNIVNYITTTVSNLKHYTSNPAQQGDSGIGGVFLSMAGSVGNAIRGIVNYFFRSNTIMEAGAAIVLIYMATRLKGTQALMAGSIGGVLLIAIFVAPGTYAQEMKQEETMPKRIKEMWNVVYGKAGEFVQISADTMNFMFSTTGEIFEEGVYTIKVLGKGAYSNGKETWRVTKKCFIEIRDWINISDRLVRKAYIKFKKEVEKLVYTKEEIIGKYIDEVDANGNCRLQHSRRLGGERDYVTLLPYYMTTGIGAIGGTASTYLKENAPIGIGMTIALQVANYMYMDNWTSKFISQISKATCEKYYELVDFNIGNWTGYHGMLFRKSDVVEEIEHELLHVTSDYKMVFVVITLLITIAVTALALKKIGPIGGIIMLMLMLPVVTAQRSDEIEFMNKSLKVFKGETSSHWNAKDDIIMENMLIRNCKLDANWNLFIPLLLAMIFGKTKIKWTMFGILITPLMSTTTMIGYAINAMSSGIDLDPVLMFFYVFTGIINGGIGQLIFLNFSWGFAVGGALGVVLLTPFFIIGGAFAQVALGCYLMGTLLKSIEETGKISAGKMAMIIFLMAMNKVFFYTLVGGVVIALAKYHWDNRNEGKSFRAGTMEIGMAIAGIMALINPLVSIALIAATAIIGFVLGIGLSKKVVFYGKPRTTITVEPKLDPIDIDISVTMEGNVVTKEEGNPEHMEMQGVAIMVLALVASYFLGPMAGMVVGALGIVSFKKNGIRVFPDPGYDLTPKEGLAAYVTTFGELAIWHHGYGWYKGSTFHTMLHVTGINAISINDEMVEPHSVDIRGDRITYGGPSQLERIKPGRCTYLKFRNGLYIEVKVSGVELKEGILGTEVVSVATDDFRQGDSGTPLMQNGSCVGFLGNGIVAGGNDHSIVFKDTLKKLPIEVENAISNRHHYVNHTSHCGSGKTRNLIPRLITEHKRKGGKHVVILVPNKVVAKELYDVLKKEWSVTSDVKGIGTRLVGQVTIICHAAAVNYIKYQGKLKTSPTLYIVDESHAIDADTYTLRTWLKREVVLKYTSAIFLSATTSHKDFSTKSNYGIYEEKVTLDNAFFKRIAEHVEDGKKVIWFVRSKNRAANLQVELHMEDPSMEIVSVSRETFETEYQRAVDMSAGIILTTNVSEMGANFGGDIVVDEGDRMVPTLVAEGLVQLERTNTTRSNAIQRRGRVGRRKIGIYYYVTALPIDLGDVQDNEAANIEATIQCQMLGIEEDYHVHPQGAFTTDVLTEDEYQDMRTWQSKIGVYMSYLKIKKKISWELNKNGPIQKHHVKHCKECTGKYWIYDMRYCNNMSFQKGNDPWEIIKEIYRMIPEITQWNLFFLTTLAFLFRDAFSDRITKLSPAAMMCLGIGYLIPAFKLHTSIVAVFIQMVGENGLTLDWRKLCILGVGYLHIIIPYIYPYIPSGMPSFPGKMEVKINWDFHKDMNAAADFTAMVISAYLMSIGTLNLKEYYNYLQKVAYRKDVTESLMFLGDYSKLAGLALICSIFGMTTSKVMGIIVGGVLSYCNSKYACGEAAFEYLNSHQHHRTTDLVMTLKKIGIPTSSGAISCIGIVVALIFGIAQRYGGVLVILVVLLSAAPGKIEAKSEKQLTLVLAMTGDAQLAGVALLYWMYDLFACRIGFRKGLDPLTAVPTLEKLGREWKERLNRMGKDFEDYKECHSQRVPKAERRENYVSRGYWKMESIWNKLGKPRIQGEVVEFGAGLGGFTQFLASHSDQATKIFAYSWGQKKYKHERFQLNKVKTVGYRKVRYEEKDVFTIPLRQSDWFIADIGESRGDYDVEGRLSAEYLKKMIPWIQKARVGCIVKVHNPTHPEVINELRKLEGMCGLMRSGYSRMSSLELYITKRPNSMLDKIYNTVNWGIQLQKSKNRMRQEPEYKAPLVTDECKNFQQKDKSYWTGSRVKFARDVMGLKDEIRMGLETWIDLGGKKIRNQPETQVTINPVVEMILGDMITPTAKYVSKTTNSRNLMTEMFKNKLDVQPTILIKELIQMVDDTTTFLINLLKSKGVVGRVMSDQEIKDSIENDAALGHWWMDNEWENAKEALEDPKFWKMVDQEDNMWRNGDTKFGIYNTIQKVEKKELKSDGSRPGGRLISFLPLVVRVLEKRYLGWINADHVLSNENLSCTVTGIPNHQYGFLLAEKGKADVLTGRTLPAVTDDVAAFDTRIGAIFQKSEERMHKELSPWFMHESLATLNKIYQNPTLLTKCEVGMGDGIIMLGRVGQRMTGSLNTYADNTLTNIKVQLIRTYESFERASGRKLNDFKGWLEEEGMETLERMLISGDDSVVFPKYPKEFAESVNFINGMQMIRKGVELYDPSEVHENLVDIKFCKHTYLPLKVNTTKGTTWIYVPNREQDEIFGRLRIMIGYPIQEALVAYTKGLALQLGLFYFHRRDIRKAVEAIMSCCDRNVVPMGKTRPPMIGGTPWIGQWELYNMIEKLWITDNPFVAGGRIVGRMPCLPNYLDRMSGSMTGTKIRMEWKRKLPILVEKVRSRYDQHDAPNYVYQEIHWID